MTSISNTRNKIFWALPNLLTYGRVIAVPLVVALILQPDADWARWLGLCVFILAAVTDFFDGYLARAWQQQSALGRMLDPIADKLLVASCLLALAAVNTFDYGSIWAAVIILCREILISGLREFVAQSNILVPVSRFAKWKTTVQLAAIGFLIAGPAGQSLLSHTHAIGIVLLWIAALLTLYTGLDYMIVGVRHVTEE